MAFTIKLQRFESKFCLLAWITVVLYVIYKFTISSQSYFHSYHDQYGDFTEGWAFLNFPNRDIADFEWQNIKYFITAIYPIILIYLGLSEAGRYLAINNIQFHQYFQIASPVLFLTYSMGYRVTLLALLQPAIFRISIVNRNTICTWILNILSLALIALYKKMCSQEAFLKYMGLNAFEAYMHILMLCWMNLKCTSYALNHTPKRLEEYLSYCFYLPTLFTGPFIDYEDFMKVHMRKPGTFNLRMKKLMLNILRCLFWMLFSEFWLHFIYVNATSFQLGFVKSLDLSSLCGYGYSMGQFFHIKYVVLYGLTTSVASFEDINVPTFPRCIGRIHLYSDMWKYFDPGLYKFLKTCIFIPAQKLGLAKLGASFLCFAFVFIWHGTEEYIFVWALLNFTGIVLENLASNWYKRTLSSWYWKKLCPSSPRRTKCLLSAPLLAMSALSNFYFFAGKDVGDIFLYTILNESVFKKAFIVAALYFCCEVSTAFRDINAHAP
ncbi:protein-cysteine N-palmitoyltransferase Rasp [Dendroctonus ponderosae]|uniref:Protein-cysteine N-palmitoyltransferase Rasp n=1 Tax=Dendroctonus ponderosae TaxID=77166 RepID=U4U2K1_DENPD|nr:protein-cysteine N-palmitoyltransferase Rasp [Dendroctonus ponderosae]XP_019759593.2 protein-cysteine N-palmitoyltransferase Rasp [Dendroctonus ponderosae]ERL83691.1 hypothetical protein D910_00875 [Dendroctonus ponderosae]ERL88104.1 hypothetical protein D910_05493 [Dendroctonus ponderosae]KAH0999052.1 hypothetical protein HUJ05_006815 [Dendroctonus ponderosae]KAH1015472.1 hypothetical protein HUJ05_013188 [Dendroctonus ponderosae]